MIKHDIWMCCRCNHSKTQLLDVVQRINDTHASLQTRCLSPVFLDSLQCAVHACRDTQIAGEQMLTNVGHLGHHEFPRGACNKHLMCGFCTKFLIVRLKLIWNLSMRQSGEPEAARYSIACHYSPHTHTHTCASTGCHRWHPYSHH